MRKFLFLAISIALVSTAFATDVGRTKQEAKVSTASTDCVFIYQAPTALNDYQVVEVPKNKIGFSDFEAPLQEGVTADLFARCNSPGI